MSEIKQLSSSIVYQNKWMTVHEDKIQRESGTEGLYGIVEKPDFAIIIPIMEDSLILVDQYRYPLQRRSLEFPQGACENNPDISPEDLAIMELKEETGLIAGSMQHISKQALAVGFCTQYYNIFVATNLKAEEASPEEEEEGLTVLKVKIIDFEQMILRGDIVDATTCNAFGLAKLRGLI